MHGLLIPRLPNLSRKPSQHYSPHIERVSAALQKFATAFVDGALAVPSGAVEALPFEEQSGYARVALVDGGLLQQRCLVVSLWARPENDLAGTPSNCDARGTPSLLGAVRTDGKWQIYNCYLTLVPADRDALNRGEYPRPA
jgi:hypothetical protein